MNTDMNGKETKPETNVCQIDKQSHRLDQLIPGAFVRPAIVDTIRKTYPDWSPEGYICEGDLDRFRAQYVQDAIQAEKGELTQLEADVIHSLKKRQLLAKNVNAEFDKKMTFGERAADKVAEFGGSWRFISIFGAVLFGWIIFNAFV